MALKASPEEQALLLDIQAIDTKLSQLDHQAKSLPEHAALQQLAVENSELLVTLAEQKGVLEDARIELKRVESDVEVVEARISRDSARLQASSSVKDVAALEQELAALKKRQFDLEEIELTVMEKVEQQDVVVGHLAEQAGAVQGKMADLEGIRDSSLRLLDEARDNANANRVAIVTKVSPELLALYEKQRQRYGSGASLLRGGVSLASGVKLNENDMVAIRAAAPDEVVMCPDSNAILVRTGGVRPLMVARELIVEADGGSRGNPGVAGSGSIVIDAGTGEVLAEVGTYVGIASNNVAEYRGLIAGIRKALEIDPDANLHVRMDSKLVIEQMSGRWKIKHPDMADLAAEARQLLTGTPVSFEWMPRADNSRADKVANEVMDIRQSFQRGAAGEEKRQVRFE